MGSQSNGGSARSSRGSAGSLPDDPGERRTPVTTMRACSIPSLTLIRARSPAPETVPEAVSQVVRKATAKTVEMRYQSAGEIEQDLQKAASALLLESGT